MPRSIGERLRNRKKFDGLLAVLADRIGIDDNFERRANAAANRLFRKLQEKSKYSLDRFMIAGGVGKKTSIDGHADYDCVVYINGEKPPFDDVIEEFEELIVDHLGTDVKTTPYSLQFQLDGVDFDLLPATNEVATHNTSDTAREQVRKTLQKMKSVPAGKLRYYSAGLAEGAVGFIKSRSLFVHRFIKLCKYWTLGVNARLSGRSTMVETVAVDIAEPIAARKKCSRSFQMGLRLALVKFLEKMQRGDLDVAFDYNYEKSDIPSHIARERPLVLDVTNPRNNLLSHGLPGAFSTKARESLKVITKLNTEAYQRDLQLSDIETIF